MLDLDVREAVLPRPPMAPAQVPLVRDGEIVADLTNPAEAQARCAERRSRLQDADRTPWPTHSPAIPTVWEGVEEPLSTPVPSGGAQ